MRTQMRYRRALKWNVASEDESHAGRGQVTVPSLSSHMHTHTHTLIGISTTCMHGLDTRSHTHTKAGFVFLSGRRSVRVLWVVRRCVNYLNMLLMVSIQWLTTLYRQREKGGGVGGEEGARGEEEGDGGQLAACLFFGSALFGPNWTETTHTSIKTLPLFYLPGHRSYWNNKPGWKGVRVCVCVCVCVCVLQCTLGIGPSPGTWTVLYPSLHLNGQVSLHRISCLTQTPRWRLLAAACHIYWKLILIEDISGASFVNGPR